MKNHVWYVTAPGKVSLLEEPLPTLGVDDVLVEVEACGICMLDYHLFTGKIVPNNPPYPHPHGHEAVGRVLETGAKVTYCKPGDRVGVIHGFAMAEKIVCKEREVAKLPGTGDAARFITEPLTCVVQFVNNLQFIPGQNIAIFGLGYMGLLILQMLPKTSGRVMVVEPRESLYPLAQELGADLCLNPKQEDPAVTLKKECPDGFDIVIDACGGIKTVCEGMPRLLKRAPYPFGPQWGFFSSPTQPLKFELDMNELGASGVRLVNSGTRDRLRDHRTAAGLLSNGAVSQTQLITHRFKFQELQQALETKTQLQPNWIKGVIEMT